MRLKLYLIAFSILIINNLYSQDLHFTQYFLSPLQLNPANTGDFFGSIRLGGIYRGQNFTPNNIGNYRTPLIYGDAPLKGLRRKDWIGLGVTFYQDQAGVVSVTNSGIFGSAAYHFAVTKDAKTVLSAGLMAGYAQLKIGDRDKLQFADAIKSGAASTDLNSINTQTVRDLDVSAGLTFKTPLNNAMNMTLGFAVRHINRPRKLSLVTSGTTRKKLNYSFNGAFDLILNDKLTITPQFMFQTTAKQREVMVQAISSYKLKKDNPLRVQAGLGYRLGDAAQILLGADWGNLRAGIAYDIRVSSQRNIDGGNGAFELGAAYIFKIYKNPKVDPVIFCPRF